VGKKPVLRTCVGCRNSFDKNELIRVIRNSDGELKVDKTGKANGRGAYICNNAECFRLAKRNKGLARSLDVSIPDSIYEELEKEVESDAG
jgi:predicted RNA-binding protein YlxR (DUF448 family)